MGKVIAVWEMRHLHMNAQVLSNLFRHSCISTSIIGPLSRITNLVIWWISWRLCITHVDTYKSIGKDGQPLTWVSLFRRCTGAWPTSRCRPGQVAARHRLPWRAQQRVATCESMVYESNRARVPARLKRQDPAVAIRTRHTLFSS